MPRIPLGLDEYAYVNAIPKDNPLTPQKVALGKLLFFDKRLSADGTIACATCHNPRFAFTDGRKFPEGINGHVGARNVPTLLNRVFGRLYFLDGRAASLEEQTTMPLLSPTEMGSTRAQVERTLSAIPGYRRWFRAAYGTEKVTLPRVARAIAAFERTLLSAESPYDLYEYGGPEGALSAAAQRGLKLFKTKARCIQCHKGITYSDEQFHNVGVGWERADTTTYTRTHNPADIRGIDPGRFARTGRSEDFGAFKTPTLRDVAQTAPYGHDGSFATLEEVVAHYSKGGIPNPFLDAKIEPLNLTEQEEKDLVAFLKSLDGESWKAFEVPHQFPK